MAEFVPVSFQFENDPAYFIIDDIYLSDMTRDVFQKTKNCSFFRLKEKSQEIYKRVQVNFFEFPSSA